MLTIIICYVVFSLMVGFIDIIRELIHEKQLSHTPISDIRFFVVPKHIYGFHNYVFLPSWVVVMIWRFIAKLFRRLQ